MSGSDNRVDYPQQPPQVSRRLLTVPNLLCFIRLGGSPLLVAAAWLDQRDWFLWGFLFFSLTDWLDGKLAILLDQRSVYGARLDSMADATLYASMLAGAVLLHGQVLLAELAWVVAATASYLLSTVAGLLKYGRWPSYHTRAAKSCWLFILAGVVCLHTDWSLWPLRFALAAVVITNIEAFLITLISPIWRNDVSSLYHAWKHEHP